MATREEFKRTFFDRSAVDQAVDRALKRTLSKFGAFVRQRARTSIRKRKAVSPPGSPPSSHEGSLRKGILFGYEAETKTVVIGPAAFRQGAEAPRLLEHGGDTVIVRRKKQRAAKYAPRPFMQPARDAELPKFMDSLKDSVTG